MIRRPPRSTLSSSSAASDVYKRQALVSVPMVIILFNNINFKTWLKNYVKWVAVFIFPLLLFVRLASAFDFLPSTILKREFHNKKQWVKDIEKLAENRPVVFTNSYQRPAVYTF